MEINAADIYSISKGSLKDAIVSFGGFCTAELISDKGLLLTNHHCGFDTIQNHSSVQNNYIRDGFWAYINYGPSIYRNIMVDIRYVLFIIDKYAEAKNLIAEMNLVHPKKVGKK